MLAALPRIEPGPLLDAVRQLDADDEVPEALSLLRDCGHPDAVSVVARLAGQPQLVPVARPPGSPGAPGPSAAGTARHTEI
jgi:hypothetical protein